LACELIAWTQVLALTGKARLWEPKRLRLRLHFAQNWPWAAEVTTPGGQPGSQAPPDAEKQPKPVPQPIQPDRERSS
jgi:hypothetical protein